MNQPAYCNTVYTSVDSAADPCKSYAGKAASAKLSQLSESIKVEHQFVRVPFEHFKKTIRTNHRSFEKDISSAISAFSSTSPQLQVQSYKGKGNCKGRDKDWISNLPDEVIVVILSKLHLKEAGKTSVLSKRWRYLWTYLTDLVFDDYDTLFSLPHVNDRFIKVNKYVNWVNHVLYARPTLHLNSLKIHFTLYHTYSSYVNNWFYFAMTTKLVKHLYLNVGTYASDPIGNACYLKPISYIYKNENLRSLSLVSVNLSDQLLDSILPHCPNLERLSLSYCHGFTRLKLVAASSASKNKLKHLLMLHCNDTYHVDIYAPNLTCFTFAGWPMHNVNFLHVPNLTEVAFGGTFSLYLLENLQGSYSEYIIKYLDSFLRFSSQLHKVSLAVHKEVRYSSSALGAAFSNLKNLELMVRHDHNCVLLTSFIEACPLLETFKLKFTQGQVSGTGYATNLNREETPKLKHEHKKLKTVEYVGVLIGSESTVNLALCLTKQASFLETFRFECCFLGCDGERRLRYRNQYADKLSLYSVAARSLADKIRLIKPVNIVIMCD